MFVVKELMIDSVLQSTVPNMTSNVMPCIAAAEVVRYLHSAESVL